MTSFHQASVPFSQSIANRVDGAYTYRLEGCYLKQYQNFPEAYEVCETVGDTLAVTVDGPDPDSVGTQLGYTFQARVNNTNPANATAIFIDRTSSATGGGVFQDIVLRKSGNTFELVDPGSVTGTAPGSWSTTTAVDLMLNDINLDGFVDILVRGLGSAITGALDQIVYAPGRSGGSPVILNAVDSSLTNFLSEVSSWTQDPTYFQRHQEPGEVTVTVYRPDCFNAESRRFCSSIPTVVIEVSGARPTNKSSEAREFAQQFTVANGRINPDVTLGSQRARNLSGILQRVFGTEVLRGQLESACTGFFDYDSRSKVSCRNGNEVGLILLHHDTELLQVLQRYDPTADRQSTPVGRQRDLTENEVTLAENNGLDTIDLTGVRIEHSSIFYVDEDGTVHESAWWVDLAHPNTIFVPKLFTSSDGQLINRHFEENFTSIDKQAVLIHELTHVHQYTDGNWVHGGRGTETGFHKYGYRDSDGNLEHSDFNLYSDEEQAEIMADRFRLKSGQSPAFSDCDDSAEPCNAPSNLTITQMYSQLDLLDNIPEDVD